MAIELVFSSELSDWEDLVKGEKSPNTPQERKFVETIAYFSQKRTVAGLLSLGKTRFEQLKYDLRGLYSSRIPGKGNKNRLIMRVEEFTYDEAIKLNPDFKKILKSENEPLIFLHLLFIDDEHYKQSKRWLKSR